MLMEEPSPQMVNPLVRPLAQFAQRRRERGVPCRWQRATPVRRRTLREAADVHATQAGGLRRDVAGSERRADDGERHGEDAAADDAGNHEGPPVGGFA